MHRQAIATADESSKPQGGGSLGPLETAADGDGVNALLVCLNAEDDGSTGQNLTFNSGI